MIAEFSGDLFSRNKDEVVTQVAQMVPEAFGYTVSS